MRCNINEVLVDPDDREERMKRLLKEDGLSDSRVRQIVQGYIQQLGKRELENDDIPQFLEQILTHLESTGFLEAEDACYSGLALTGLDEKTKPLVLEDHHYLREAVKDAGLRGYDPAEAPYNPNEGLVGQPQEVSDVDTLMLASSRFFTFTNLAPSSGGGIELRSANLLNKIPLVLTQKGVYTSRMTTGARRIILLEYSDMKRQKGDITEILMMLREFSPGIGTCEKHGNTLIGQRMGETYCLPDLVERCYPELKYDFSQYGKK